MNVQCFFLPPTGLALPVTATVDFSERDGVRDAMFPCSPRPRKRGTLHGLRLKVDACGKLPGAYLSRNVTDPPGAGRRAPGYEVFTELSHFPNICFS
jgi:hypothetical protein